MINVIIDSIINRDASNLIRVIDIKNFFLMTNWYVWELLMLYIVFYMSIRFNNNLKKVSIIISCFSIIFVSIAYILKFENPWYGSTLCFVLGIFYYLYRKQFIEIFVLRNPAIKFASCCLIMTVAIGLFFVQRGIIGLLVSRNIASVFFVILLLSCLHRISVGNNVSAWLGKSSYQIFLFHPLFINTLRPWIRNDVIYSFLVMGVTILASYVYILCEIKMKNIVNKLKS